MERRRIPRGVKRSDFIRPLHKKGDVERVENRGIILLNAEYKIYAGIKRETEKRYGRKRSDTKDTGWFQKGKRYNGQHLCTIACSQKGGLEKRKNSWVLYRSQSGFRQDRQERTMENDEGKRNKEWFGRKDQREIYASTKNAVRVKRKVLGSFWAEKGVRQECPLSSGLFSILIADVEKELKKDRTGEVLIGKRRIWSLAYADDSVLLAKNEEGIKEMMKRMER